MGTIVFECSSYECLLVKFFLPLKSSLNCTFFLQLLSDSVLCQIIDFNGVILSYEVRQISSELSFVWNILFCLKIGLKVSSLSDIYLPETCTYLKELKNTSGVKFNNFVMHIKKTKVHWSWHFSWGVVHFTDTGSVTAWPVSLRACHSSSIALSMFRCHCCYHR